MKGYSRQTLNRVLRELGVRRGATLLLHSRLFALGPLIETPVANIPDAIIDCFMKLLGPYGTLVLPTYFYEYAREQQPFNCHGRQVSREMGALAVAALERSQARRSAHPVFNLPALGYHAAKLAGKQGRTAFGTESAWDMLTRLDARMLFFGVLPAEAMTYIHYIEHHFGVPHAYHKMFLVPVNYGRRQRASSTTAFVRHRDFAVTYRLVRFMEYLAGCGALRRRRLGSGSVWSVNMQSALNCGTACLVRDPYYFLEREPAFIAGVPPLV
ncbi:MAG: hypothetical protein A2107_09125 [Verrucomicrobia bacterium GWF2_62_7]|nr:MAG: hypothetical protein A2107_09125 [Verrucomicrobia bacterium GWF2_62_7]